MNPPKNESLLETLKALPDNPAVVVVLYKQLFEGNFLSIIQKGTQQDLNSMSFLTYETKDGKRELPIFTQKEFVLNFSNANSEIIYLSGELFWKRLLNIVETDVKLTIAVDPGQKHGIRITAPMILGMITKYDKPIE